MREPISNTAQVKTLNTERVRAALKKLTSATKAQIAANTGLSIATCGTILNEMLVTKEVKKGRLLSSNGGRPATSFTYNLEYSHILCLYISEGKGSPVMSYAVANTIGEIIEEDTRTPQAFTVDNLLELVEEILQKYDNINGISIGLPGEIQDGFIDFCDIKTLEGIQLEQKLLEKGCNQNIIIENDMSFITYGFYKTQDRAELNNLAAVYFPGDAYPGCGLIINGKVIKGDTMFAGELAYSAMGYGISREEQRRWLEDPKLFPQLAAKMIGSIIAIVNPKKIVLMGNLVEESAVARITQLLQAYIPEKHIPQIVHQADIHSYYINGLINLTLNELKINVPSIRA